MTNSREHDPSVNLGTLRSKSLSELNRLAEAKQFRLSDHEFQKNIYETQSLWAPENLTPFYYLKSFRHLTRPQRVRYNQLFALGVLEQFIWFEGELLGKILQKVLVQTSDGEFRKALQYFLEDEVKHTEMFWQILQTAAPEIYPERNFHLFNLNPIQQTAIRFLVSKPQWNLAWVWMAIFFEERTLDYSHRYIQVDRKLPGTLDSRFVQAHRLHLLDETRHFQMDLHFLANFYDPASFLQKQWAAFSMKKLMLSYISPRRVSLRILDRMKIEFPDFTDDVAMTLRQELSLIRYNKAFINTAFGSGAVPRSRELMMRYPEMSGLLSVMT
jgi:hypothetical protein